MDVYVRWVWVWALTILTSCISAIAVGCVDTFKNCSVRAENYECLRVPGEMSCVCAKSCNTLSECELPATGKELHCECLNWVQKGGCETRTPYMKKNCHSTCLIRRASYCPPPPAYTRLKKKYLHGTNYMYADVVTYFCAPEYTLLSSGPPEALGMKVCDENFNWVAHGIYGELPQCVSSVSPDSTPHPTINTTMVTTTTTATTTTTTTTTTITTTTTTTTTTTVPTNNARIVLSDEELKTELLSRIKDCSNVNLSFKPVSNVFVGNLSEISAESLSSCVTTCWLIDQCTYVHYGSDLCTLYTNALEYVDHIISETVWMKSI